MFWTQYQLFELSINWFYGFWQPIFAQFSFRSKLNNNSSQKRRRRRKHNSFVHTHKKELNIMLAGRFKIKLISLKIVRSMSRLLVCWVCWWFVCPRSNSMRPHKKDVTNRYLSASPVHKQQAADINNTFDLIAIFFSWEFIAGSIPVFFWFFRP